MNMPIKEVSEVEIQHDVWLFKDSQGNTAWAVCDDSSDTIQVCGLVDAKGESAYFESEAYHAPQWCVENAIECVTTTRKFTLSI